MNVSFQHFASATKSWNALFEDAASFATKIGPDRLISISHSHGGTDHFGTGVVTVWYWDEAPRRR